MTETPRAATHARLYETEPQCVDTQGAKHWIVRAANFVTVVTLAPAGTTLERDDADEYMALLPPGSEATITGAGETVHSRGYSLTIVPPGPGRIVMETDGLLARMFSISAADLADRACNAAIYAGGAPEVAPARGWPAPADGFRLRHYDLGHVASPDKSPLRMRVFRCSKLMINVFEPWAQRRDETRLTPHSHDDFEQMSLGMRGAFVHHLRYPWTANVNDWRPDEHERYEQSPSVLVIPAKVIHTTQDVGDGATWLIDMFSPPRKDFSMIPGFVINAATYPMPAIDGGGG